MVFPNSKRYFVATPFGLTAPLSLAFLALMPFAFSVAAFGTSASNAPMSQAGPRGREWPRWSVAGQPESPAALIAGLPFASARVRVGPPFDASGPRRAFVLILSPGPVRPHVLPLSRLCPWEETSPRQLALVSAVFRAKIVARAVTVPP